ncbi:MAG: AAA family ATPase [Bacteroidetes bacterium GWF2_38_335]|nr:MAG: AAA family ATPase [Bacteroidetes bacterium GWF2_38_335]OFY77962.1 MAG: AAA family ATPase [Bacteroidetes bacterium RIFOXYA12_FULL_38_20]HBS86704.1 AAA family ATPase [Bacteroidales bacterium]
MEILIEKSEKKAKLISGKKRRYLFDQIDWSQRLIVILGYRGTGKTTLILQHLSVIKEKGIYLSMDDLYFETHRLVETVGKLYDLGYRTFLVDEVHRYGWWSKDLKQLYDDYEDIKVIATGSSILNISKGSADLSRRAAIYYLHGLSFREYLSFQKNINLPPLKLEDILNNHHVIAPDLVDSFNYNKDFQHYLEYGFYPFFMEAKQTYYQKLLETINLVIDTDIAPFEDLQHSTTRTMKKLLYVLSESVPFTPNINKLSDKLETPRNTILRILDFLDKAQIIQLLKTSVKGVSYLQKPEKVYLQNTNFVYMFSPRQANVGNVRETFFLNQLNVVHEVTSARFGDFMVDATYAFEVGGPSKTNEQIRGVPNAYLALHIESGNTNRIPLWLFGMLY